MDHLLVMPVTPFEIAMSKIWANGLVITLAVGISLNVIVQMLLGIPVAGSVALFLAAVVIYLFFATAIGIFLATVARTMPQLGLLYLLVATPMNILSGSSTPLGDMPRLLQIVMQASPSTHFVSFARRFSTAARASTWCGPSSWLSRLWEASSSASHCFAFAGFQPRRLEKLQDLCGIFRSVTSVMSTPSLSLYFPARNQMQPKPRAFIDFATTPLRRRWRGLGAAG